MGLLCGWMMAIYLAVNSHRPWKCNLSYKDTIEGQWNQTLAILLSTPAPPNFNVVFGLRARVCPVDKRIKPWTQRKLDRVLFNIELWGVGFYLVDVCRVWFFWSIYCRTPNPQSTQTLSRSTCLIDCLLSEFLASEGETLYVILFVSFPSHLIEFIWLSPKNCRDMISSYFFYWACRCTNIPIWNPIWDPVRNIWNSCPRLKFVGL